MSPGHVKGDLKSQKTATMLRNNLTQLFPHDRALPAFIWLLFNLRFHGLNNFTGCTFLSHLHCVFSHVSLNFMPVRIQTYIWWFSNVSSKDLPKRVHGHTDCIRLTFLHCVFLKESLYRLGERMHSHNGYINLIRLRCVFLDGPSKGLPWKIHCHIGCICFGFLLCALSNVSSNRLP